MKLPKITRKQEELLILLYRYRFLNRIQIQTLMGHKDRKTINLWLRDLKAKQYIEWIYSTHFAEKTKPAIYYIAINGVRFLRTLDEYPPEDVRKRYRESSRSQTYIDRCIVLANCCITLKANCTDTIQYSFVTESDYNNPISDYHFLSESEIVQPNLCFMKEETKPGQELVSCYLLEVFDATLPRYRMKLRLSNYVNYLDNGEWETETEYNESPIILLVCARTVDLTYAKRRTRVLLADIWNYDEGDRPHIRFATMENLQKFGIIGKIWEEA